MDIVDLDSHFYEPLDWLEKRFPKLARELPSVDPFELILTTALGDLVGDLPEHVRVSDPLSVLPPHVQAEFRNATPERREEMGRMAVSAFATVRGGHDAAQRIAHLDELGITCQLILPSFAYHTLSYVRRHKPERTAAFIGAYNVWALEAVAGHVARLIPALIVDLHTMTRNEVLDEMTRGRAAGSRCVAFHPTPARGKSLAHPDFEWFWAAAADLGLLTMIHVAAGSPTVDPAWFNNGRPYPSSILSYWEQAPQVPEMVLTELLLSGVFARHANLRVIVCEYGVDWLPAWLRRIDLFADGHPVLWGAEPLRQELRPSEYARRQIRVTPLPFDRPASIVRELAGEIVVFGSDYPHPEGGANAVAVFEQQLDGLPSDVLAKFFGKIAARDLAES